jgi:phosphoribosylaminoimidazole-succinocarboxamide synthase
MLVKRLEIIPIEIVVRNIAAGSISKRLGIGEGQKLPRTVIEFYLKDDELHDPMVNHYHIYALGLAQPREMEEIEKQALLVNDALISYFNERGITVVDFKLEFGRHDDGILLGDEISPDTCRLWDSLTGKKMDKDRFRRDLGGVIEAYKEILERIEG